MAKIFEFKKGDEVLLKTREQLLEDGWFEDDSAELRCNYWDNVITIEMCEYLGTVVKITDAYEYGEFEAGDETAGINWSWHDTCVAVLETFDMRRILEEIRREIYEE